MRGNQALASIAKRERERRENPPAAIASTRVHLVDDKADPRKRRGGGETERLGVDASSYLGKRNRKGKGLLIVFNRSSKLPGRREQKRRAHIEIFGYLVRSSKKKRGGRPPADTVRLNEKKKGRVGPGYRVPRKPTAHARRRETGKKRRDGKAILLFTISPRGTESEGRRKEGRGEEEE